MNPAPASSRPRGTARVALVSTGGTIEKTYDELHGVLTNEVSVLEVMLGQLELPGLTLDRVALMNKDSLEMTSEDHEAIAQAALSRAREYDGVVIVHGTDRLTTTGDLIHSMEAAPSAPIILTGAMRPYELRSTDALQNLVEALFAARVAPPGVHLAMHGRLLTFPGIRKDKEQGTFVPVD